jgi:nucleoside-diphosphate-sugar epimerase
MKALVTGASGFIGRALVGELINHDFEVTAVIRKEVEHKAKEVFVVHNINGQTQWPKEIFKTDVVFHLAAYVHVMQRLSSDSAVNYFAVNLDGTTNLARQGARAGVKRFVYVSSIKVNGEYTAPGSAFNESSIPDPQNPYAISKWEAEQALHAIGQETGMEIVIIRPPLVYGPGVKANFARLLSLVDRGIPLPLGGVENARSLILVDNLADALITCATHPAAAGKTYLVSDGEAISTPQLIKAISMALGRPSRNFPVPVTLMRQVAKLLGKSAAIERLTQSLVIDSSKIRSELGWTPPFTMAQGLKATADWYRSANPGPAP